MGVWDRLKFEGQTNGIWESGSRIGKPLRPGGGARLKWAFKDKKSRRFGRGFYAALNRMPESEFKKIIMNIVKQKEPGKKITEKQWNYLGLLMTKADPACLSNPTLLPKTLKNSKEEIKHPIIVRKRKRDVYETSI